MSINNTSDNLKNLDIKEIRKIIPKNEGIRMDDDFMVIDVNDGKNLQFMNYPFRTNAYFSVFCQNGGVDVEINLTRHSMKSDSMMIIMPGSIIRVVDPINSISSQGHFIIVAISKELLSNISIDMTKLFDRHLDVLSDPCFQIGKEERDFLFKYLTLIKDVMDADISSRKDAVASLIASSFYVLGGLMEKRMVRGADSQSSTSAQLRMKMLFDNFMSLVGEYHTTERGMAFYASRLGLTPKYLSKLIKQYSGRPAPEWIDSFVILEAKNMLKYSGLTIKEIVYNLNFPNPSVFYKYFKSHTGMTPSEYRNE